MQKKLKKSDEDNTKLQEENREVKCKILDVTKNLKNCESKNENLEKKVAALTQVRF